MKLGHFIKEEFSHDNLSELLKSFGRTYSGKRTDTMIDEINEHLSSEELTSEHKDIFNESLLSAIKYNKRRYLYISHLSFTDCRRLSNVKVFEKALDKLLGKTNNFNELNNPENNKLKNAVFGELNPEFLNVQKIRNSIDKCETCFSYYRKEERTVENETVADVFKEYFWVEMNFSKRIMVLRLPTISQEVFGVAGNNRLFNKLFDLLISTFSLNIEDMLDFKEVFYNVFKEITENAERPFKEKFKQVEKEVGHISNTVHGLEIYKNEDSKQLFEERLSDLIERVLIFENFKEYLTYSEGKYAILSKMQFTDATGASVSARAGTKHNDTLELSDIFFDTRKTIENEKSVNTLWIEWFKVSSGEEVSNADKVQKFTTKFATHRNYYLIHFHSINLTKEVEEIVFSRISRFGGVRW